jgi:hypothetical protein
MRFQPSECVNSRLNLAPRHERLNAGECLAHQDA